MNTICNAINSKVLLLLGLTTAFFVGLIGLTGCPVQGQIDPHPRDHDTAFCEYHPDTDSFEAIQLSIAVGATYDITVLEQASESCSGDQLSIVGAEADDPEIFSIESHSNDHVQLMAHSKGASLIRIELADGRIPEMLLTTSPTNVVEWSSSSEYISQLLADDDMDALRMLTDTELRVDYRRYSGNRTVLSTLLSGWGDVDLEVAGSSDIAVDIDERRLEVFLQSSGVETDFEVIGNGIDNLDVEVVDVDVDHIELLESVDGSDAGEHFGDGDTIQISPQTEQRFELLAFDADKEYLAGASEPAFDIVDGDESDIEISTHDGQIDVSGPPGSVSVEVNFRGASAQFDFVFSDS